MPSTKQQQLSQQHQPCRNPAGRILGSLDWGCLLIIIALGVTTAKIQHMAPTMRPVFQPDATIGHKHLDHDMPFVTALLVPVAVLVATVLAVECLFVKQSWQRRTVTLINILLTFMAAMAVVGFLTELFKRLAGRLRWVKSGTALSSNGGFRKSWCKSVCEATLCFTPGLTAELQVSLHIQCSAADFNPFHPYLFLHY
jgi:hypothetical protein